MLWLNIFVNAGLFNCAVIYTYKHGIFNKRRQTFNKSIKIRKKTCSALTMMREFPSRKWKRSTLCDLIERIDETGDKKVAADRDLQERQQTFIEPENWLPNSPDLDPVDYSVLGALPQTVYRHIISDTDQLKCVLIDCWAKNKTKPGPIELSDRSAAKD